MGRTHYWKWRRRRRHQNFPFIFHFFSSSFPSLSLPPFSLIPNLIAFILSHVHTLSGAGWGERGGKKKWNRREERLVLLRLLLPPPSPLFPFLIQFSIFFLPPFFFFRGSTKLPFFPRDFFSPPLLSLVQSFLAFPPLSLFLFFFRVAFVCRVGRGKGRDRVESDSVRSVAVGREGGGGRAFYCRRWVVPFFSTPPSFSSRFFHTRKAEIV